MWLRKEFSIVIFRKKFQMKYLFPVHCGSGVGNSVEVQYKRMYIGVSPDHSIHVETARLSRPMNSQFSKANFMFVLPSSVPLLQWIHAEEIKGLQQDLNLPSLHERNQKTFCNVVFCGKNEACVKCGTHKRHSWFEYFCHTGICQKKFL